MRALAGILTGLFLLQGALGLAVKSGTCDELGAHLPAGILFWKSGQFSGGLANPPLGQALVAAGPVLTGTADHPLRDSPRDLLPARLPVLLMGAGIVLLTGAIGRRLGGDRAGIAALGAAALCPDLVAHSRLATLDVPATFLFTLAAWSAWSWRRSGSAMALAGWSLAAGAACLTKHSALHLVPAVAVGAALFPGRPTSRLRDALVLTGTAAAGIMVAAWLSYGAASGPVPREYLDGLLEKWRHGREGHFAYLFGERSASGFPHYFLIALAVKLPLPLLITAAAGSAVLVRRRAGGDARGFLATVALPGAWLLAAVSLLHRVDIGVRHVLPLYPALFALAGTGWARLAERGGAARGAAVLLALWAAFAAARITPDHLAYFNELAGGPDGGSRVLIDSNLDWGQDERRFRDWAAGQDIAVNPDEPRAGHVAANVNALRGIFAPDDARLGWLQIFPPDTTIGHTWRVWTVTEDPLREAATRSPLRALDYARFLRADGRPQEAARVLARNDLSGHPGAARRWWRLTAECALDAGDLTLAAEAAPRSGDADLAAEVSYRISETRGDSWTARPPQERERIFGALMRRGRRGEAVALPERVRRDVPRAAFPDYDRVAGPPPAGIPARIARASTWRDLGDEETALREIAAVLADAPADADALWLYGELVVRRKLGLKEYPLPDPDWSAVRGRPGESRP
ncbi:MAG TPA: glycosyltransferase family 39 protein [bacterium]|nr:glycosyltransferase family 39 protein [bacterium]